MIRKFTNKLLEMVEYGIINEEILIKDLLNNMTDGEVEDFAIRNGYFLDEEDEEPEYPQDEIDEEEQYESDKYNADRIDGYDRDDLGESPDY